MLMRITAYCGFTLLLLAGALGQPSMRETVDKLLRAAEPSEASAAELRNLPVQSLPHLAATIEEAQHPAIYTRAIEMLVAKRTTV